MLCTVSSVWHNAMMNWKKKPDACGNHGELRNPTLPGIVHAVVDHIKIKRTYLYGKTIAF
jgi:hypothetical protein